MIPQKKSNDSDTDRYSFHVIHDAKLGLDCVATFPIQENESIYSEQSISATVNVKDHCFHCMKVFSGGCVPCRNIMATGCGTMYCSSLCEHAAYDEYGHANMCESIGPLWQKLTTIIKSSQTANSKICLMIVKIMGLVKQSGFRPLEFLEQPPWSMWMWQRCVPVGQKGGPGDQKGGPVTRSIPFLTVQSIATAILDELEFEQNGEIELWKKDLDHGFTLNWFAQVYDILMNYMTHSVAIKKPHQAISDEIKVSHCGEQCHLGMVTSLFNHSCLPNARVEQVNDLTIIRAVRDILPGESIRISYCDEAYPMIDRQMMLSTQYGFNCECLKCTSDSKYRLREPVVTDKLKA